MGYGLVLFDVDGTIIDKRSLDDHIYAEVTRKHLGIELRMMTHIDGTTDPLFATKSNHRIFAERIQEALRQGTLKRSDGKTYNQGQEITDSDADFFVRNMGEEGYKFVRDNPEQARTHIKTILPVETVRKLTVGVIGIGTAGSQRLQEVVMETTGYFSHGINQKISAYAEDSIDGTKENILVAAMEKAADVIGKLPKTVVYVGDSPKDMQAVRNLGDRFYGIGVQSSGRSKEELADALNGRGIIIETLALPQERLAAKTYIASLPGL